MTTLTKRFSKGFQEDILDLIELCKENKTNDFVITLAYPKVTLHIKMIFTAEIKEKET